MRNTVAVLTALLLVACDSPAEPDDRWEIPEKIRFATSLGVDLNEMTRTPSGLYWQDLTVGDGALAGIGKNITVHYTGWLPDGVRFDTSRDENQPLPFPLGGGFVIRGWDEGIVGMRVGGKRLLVIPPKLAYGRTGKGPIPPLATLVFEVELMSVRP